MQKPMKVNDEYNVWMKITPSDIMVTQVYGKNNKIDMGIGVKSVNELFVDKEPPKAEAIPLPDLNITDKLDSKFSIFLNADIPIKKIDEIAEKEISGKTFTSGKKSVTVKEIKVYGSDDKLIVKINLSGSISGNIYLAGKLYYNPETKSVGMREVDFDVSTKNALIKSANWLLHQSLTNIIEKRLVYSIAENIDQAKKLIQDNITENRTIKGIVLKGNLDKIDVDNIYITPESIIAVVYLEGYLKVFADGLSKM